MLLKPVFFLLLASYTLPVFAQSPAVNIDTELKQCQDKAQTTLDSSECYRQAMADWDKELNTQYQALLKENPESVRKALRASQRQWIKYKDSYNEATNEFYRQEQGTIWGIIAAETKMNVIKDKALSLYRLRQSTQLGD
ncbi:lysozyme inhibitor LprI family protein [uncultured Cedecea sp.]|uniref:lysozyme inhibitor LprI family protein n=1 Tax=uncultured Cedecea sp. TaxID=988762 RepID=UPI00261575E6|nr:lysozyme inhibitor LprI family protein [uncultured Cedecea sp.]